MLNGLFYFHRISDNVMTQTPLRILNTFQKLCGWDNFQNIVLVTTMWNEVRGDVGQLREAELQHGFWHSMIRGGSITHRFDLTEESAWDIINTISMSLPDERRPLQIQREMVDENKPFDGTSAGKVLINYNNGFFSNVKGIFRRFNKNPKGRKGQVPVPLQHHRFSRSPFVSSLSSYVSHSPVFTRNRSDSTLSYTRIGSSSDSAGTLSEQSYRAALENVINSLKLAQSTVEFVPVYYLKEAILAALSITQNIKVIAVFEFIVRTHIEFLP